VAILDLQTGKRQVLLRGGSHAHYIASGHLVYGQAGTLQAVAFDPVRREVRGTPVTVVPDVVTSSQGGVHFVAAHDDTIAFLSVGNAAGTPRTLVWVDRLGRETPLGFRRGRISFPRCRLTARAFPCSPTIRKPTSGFGISATRRSRGSRRSLAEMSFKYGRQTVDG
jgi:hypothetical protein